MTYPEMRELFRQLGAMTGHYGISHAIRDQRDAWAVNVTDEYGNAYPITNLRIFEQRFPHLMMVYQHPAYYGDDGATMTWMQVCFWMGQIERLYPHVQVQGALQNAFGCYELAIAKDVPDGALSRRSGIYILKDYDEVERVLAA